MSYLIHNPRIVKTRKIHECIMCQRNFSKYTYMESQIINDNGNIYTIYICMTCKNIMDFIDPNINGHYEEGCIYIEMEAYDFEGTPEQFLEYLEENNV